MRWLAVAAMVGLAAAGQPAPAGRVTIVNDLDHAVTDGPVAFPIGMLAPPPEYGAGLVLRDEAGQLTPCQIDDLNGDLRPDEVFCLVDLPARERLRLVAEWRATRPAPPAPRVSALISYRPVARPAFESEQLGWYLAHPLALDVIGKLLVPKLTIDWFFGPQPRSPAEFAAGRGQGFLQVGDSLGAGGLALQEDASQPEVLSHPLPGPGGAELLHDVLADGPLRAVVRTRIWNWQGTRGTYAATVLHLVNAGSRACETRIRFDQQPPDAQDVQIAAGYQQLAAETDHAGGDDWLASAGRPNLEGETQAGLGLFVPGGWSGPPVLTAGESPSRVVSLGPVTGPPRSVHHFAAWDRDGGLRGAAAWPWTVSRAASLRRHPLGVIVER